MNAKSLEMTEYYHPAIPFHLSILNLVITIHPFHELNKKIDGSLSKIHWIYLLHNMHCYVFGRIRKKF